MFVSLLAVYSLPAKARGKFADGPMSVTPPTETIPIASPGRKLYRGSLSSWGGWSAMKCESGRLYDTLVVLTTVGLKMWFSDTVRKRLRVSAWVSYPGKKVAAVLSPLVTVYRPNTVLF